MSEVSRKLAPVHGGQLRLIAARFGISRESLLDFSANINPAGPPLSVMKALRQALGKPAALTEYPDLDSWELKYTIANSLNLSPENVCVANGFASLLEATLCSLAIERCLLPVPAFSEYRRTLEHAKVVVVPLSLRPDQYFGYDAKYLLRSIHESACDAILLANPQNPSGVAGKANELLEILEGADRSGTTVLLDEAFIDFCPAHSLIQHVTTMPRLIVFRSVTKFFAIPGLRVAYAVCHPATAAKINRSIASWPIATLASCAVRAALHDEHYAAQSRRENERQRSWLLEEALRLNIDTYPSQANFLLMRFPAEIDVDLVWERMIVEENIVLRSCANFEALGPGHLRVAVRTEQENRRLIEALKRVLARC